MNKIKICGIRSLEEIKELAKLNIDYFGCIFAKSPRQVDLELAKQITEIAHLNNKKVVGVFVNSTLDEINTARNNCNLDIIQLHGDETPHLCEQVSNEVETIKTFRIDHKSETLIDYILKDYDEVCDYYLFDTDAKPAVGDNLKLNNWKQIAESKIEKPFFLSGGIGPGDAKMVKKFKHPDYYGVDINGLFDKEPGIKDMALILQFIHGLK